MTTANRHPSTTRAQAGDADRLIARLPVDRRLAILDAVTHRQPDAVVEYAWSRRLDDANYIAGTLLGVAWAPGGSVDHVLLIQPHRVGGPHRRIVALSVAHVLRIRAATLYDRTRIGPDNVGRTYAAGEVLAGPPLEG